MPSANGQPIPRSPRLLVVDDDPDLRRLLTEFFGGAGYAVDTADTVVAGLTNLQRTPDVVLLDLAVPGAMGGLEALEMFAARAPVIVLTANTDSSLARETLRRGAFDYVGKPFDFDRLELTVLAAIAQRRA